MFCQNFGGCSKKLFSKTEDCRTSKTKFLSDLVTFTEEILNGKLHFLCSVTFDVPLAEKSKPFYMDISTW